jgi:hypothetical protein
MLLLPMSSQIIDDIKTLRLDANGAPLEATLTQGLGHPNLMTTVGYNYTGADGCGSAAKTCWMMFEFCNKPCLVVSGRDQSLLKGEA